MVFTSPASYDITMFGDIAKDLIRMMGHSGTIPGAITAEDIPQALVSLQTGIRAAEANTTPEPDDYADEDGEEDHVTMSHRAFPLIEMLEAAAGEKCGVRWYKK